MIKSSSVLVWHVRKWRFDIAMTLDLLSVPLHQFILPCKPVYLYSHQSLPLLTLLTSQRFLSSLPLLLPLSLQESWFLSFIPHQSSILALSAFSNEIIIPLCSYFITVSWGKERFVPCVPGSMFSVVDNMHFVKKKIQFGVFCSASRKSLAFAYQLDHLFFHSLRWQQHIAKEVNLSDLSGLINFHPDCSQEAFRGKDRHNFWSSLQLKGLL